MNDFAGVYEIVHKSSANCYVGSGVNIRKRWINHRYELRHGIHHSPYLQRSWDKYGEDDFEFKVLEVVESKALLREREAYWIDQLKPVYNTMEVENFVIVHSDESRSLMTESQLRIWRKRREDGRATLSEEHRLAIGKALKGRPMSEGSRQALLKASKGRIVSEETRKKLSEANKRRKYGPMSEEQKRKLSEAHKGATLSEEHRRKIGDGLRRAYASQKRKRKNDSL